MSYRDTVKQPATEYAMTVHTNKGMMLLACQIRDGRRQGVGAVNTYAEEGMWGGGRGGLHSGKNVRMVRRRCCAGLGQAKARTDTHTHTPTCAVISIMTMQGEMVCVAPAIMAEHATTAYTPGSKGSLEKGATSSPNKRPKDPATVRRGRNTPLGTGSNAQGTPPSNGLTNKESRASQAGL
jgi:hypothetical protein